MCLALSRWLAYINSLSPHDNTIITITFPILEMRKLRHREIKSFASVIQWGKYGAGIGIQAVRLQIVRPVPWNILFLPSLWNFHCFWGEWIVSQEFKVVLFCIKAERGQKQAVWYAGKANTQVTRRYFEKDELWINTAGLSHESTMPVCASMSQQVGLCEDCLTLLKLIHALGVGNIGFHKTEKGGKKRKMFKGEPQMRI